MSASGRKADIPFCKCPLMTQSGHSGVLRKPCDRGAIVYDAG